MKIGKLFFILLCFCYTAKTQSIDKIQYILDSSYDKSVFYGNVLITQNNQILLEKSYGYADSNKQKPLTNKNAFQVASISKQFTAYAIMICQHNGLLHIDSLVCKYIPTFPYKNIRIKHLLNHSSGLPNFWDQIRPNLDTLKANGNNDVLDYLIAHPLPLQFEPGTKFQYCDIGYDFLANIIENVSGQTYQVFMHNNIFKPLKMKNTYAYMVTDISRINNKNLAIGHNLVKGKLEYAHLQPQNNFVSYLGNFYGDGSMVTTANDLALWSYALKNCTLLPCDLQALTMDSSIFVRENINYGLGWFVKNTPTGKLLYHTGGHPGNLHVIYRIPESNITFIFLSNAETANHRAIRNRVLDLLNQYVKIY
ncbi:MAG: serine hydrolase domain-containing protein [Bacteroidia bacterium]